MFLQIAGAISLFIGLGSVYAVIHCAVIHTYEHFFDKAVTRGY